MSVVVTSTTCFIFYALCQDSVALIYNGGWLFQSEAEDVECAVRFENNVSRSINIGRHARMAIDTAYHASGY